MSNYIEDDSRMHSQPWRKDEIVLRLQEEGLPLYNAELKRIETATALINGSKPDGIVRIEWHGHNQDYVFEYRSRSTPKVIESAIDSAKRYAAESRLSPPYHHSLSI